jgi:hypothetical protein
MAGRPHTTSGEVSRLLVKSLRIPFTIYAAGGHDWCSATSGAIKWRTSLPGMI